MTPYYEDESVTLYQGSVMSVLAQMPAESVQCCITSPPYWGLRDYGIPEQVWGGDPLHEHVWGDLISVNATNHTDKRRWNHTRNGRGEEQPQEKQVSGLRTAVGQGAFCECGAWRGSLGLEPTPQMFVDHMVDVFREVRRVLRTDGTLWLNLGDSYNSHQGQRKTTDPAGPKQATNEGAQGTPSRSVPGLKPKDLIGIPWRVAFALQEDGWYLRSDIIWAKPAPMPESVVDRPTRSHEYIFLLAKSEKYYCDMESIKEPCVANHGSGNGYKRDARLTYKDPNGSRGSDTPWTPPPGAKGNAKTFRGGGKYTQGQSFDNSAVVERESHGNTPNLTGLRNRRDVWTVNTEPFPDAHFATFPPALILPCVIAGSGAGAVVLDPFSGAGTTALVAKENGRKAVGIDLKSEYLDMSVRRLRQNVLPLVEVA